MANKKDETAYLLENEANRKRLMEAIESDEFIEFTSEMFAALAEKLEQGESVSEKDFAKKRVKKE